MAWRVATGARGPPVDEPLSETDDIRAPSFSSAINPAEFAEFAEPRAAAARSAAARAARPLCR